MIWMWLIVTTFLLVLFAWDLGRDRLAATDPGCHGPGPHTDALFVVPARQAFTVLCTYCLDRRNGLLCTQCFSQPIVTGGATHDHISTTDSADINA